MTSKSKTLNQIKEKVENRLELIGMGKDFLSRMLTDQALRTIINK